MDQLAAVRCGYIIGLVLFGNSGKRQNLPCFILLNVRDEVVGVKPLHDNDNGSVFLAIKATAKRVVIPVVDRAAARLRQSVVSLERVVDDNDVGPAINTLIGMRPIFDASSADLLRRYRSRIKHLADALMEHGTLSGAEVDSFCPKNSGMQRHSGFAYPGAWAANR